MWATINWVGLGGAGFCFLFLGEAGNNGADLDPSSPKVNDQEIWMNHDNIITGGGTTWP